MISVPELEDEHPPCHCCRRDEVPPQKRPLTPEEHTDRPLTGDDRARRAALLASLHEANRRRSW